MRAIGAGHIRFTGRTGQWVLGLHHFLLFKQPQNYGLGNGSPTQWMALSTSVNLIKILLHGHGRMFVPQMNLEIMKLTIEISSPVSRLLIWLSSLK